MRRLLFGAAALVLVAAGVASGCLARNYQACDAQHDCPNGLTCSAFKCVAIIVGDAGEDLAVGDMGELDGASTDANVDLARVCDTSDQCSDPTRPICTSAGQCRACGNGDNFECAIHSGLHSCEADAGRCIECTPTTQSSVCTDINKPFCGTDGTCRPCKLDSECGSDLCLSNGTCADKSLVYYVDNGGKAVATCKATGSHDGLGKATAFCDLPDAIPGTRKLIKVYGHNGFSYSEISITTGEYTIFGPGVDVAEPATIFPVANGVPMAQLVVAGGDASLTLIGMELGSRTLVSTTADGLKCTNNGAGTVTLTLKNSGVYHAALHGVQSSSCKLNLDGNRIGFNTGGGVNLSLATRYTLLNNFIYRNGSTGVFVDASSPATGTFQFNTIAHNTKATGSGGVDCGSGTVLIESSIFWMDSMTESAGGCVFVNSDVGAVDPAFVNETTDDYRITTSNTAILDKVTATVDGGGALPNHDFFGSFRPNGNGYDVGAHEK